MIKAIIKFFNTKEPAVQQVRSCTNCASRRGTGYYAQCDVLGGFIGSRRLVDSRFERMCDTKFSGWTKRGWL